MSDSSTFKFSVTVPRLVSLPGEPGERVSRETFYEWVWSSFSDQGLVGVHEGTLLCDQAAAQGIEADAWLVDSGEAPRERDWISSQEEGKAELFFASSSEAENARTLLSQIPEITLGPVEEQKPQDWDAEWKASFLNAGAGVPIPPFWRIVPPWVDSSSKTIPDLEIHEKYIKINPGAGFGTGTHETTQLCLEAIGKYSQRIFLEGQRALDFGSGSGILAIGLALLGAQVDAIEVDQLAIDNSLENAQLNGIQDQITYSRALSPEITLYRVIVANILRPVLLQFSEELVKRLRPDGVLILSGLIEKDVKPVLDQYSKLLVKHHAQVFELGEWRAIVMQQQG